MFEQPNFSKKAFQQGIIIFSLLFVPQLIINPHLFTNYDELIGNYLAFHQSARLMLSRGDFSIWDPRLFLGHSFWVLQNSYSVFNPFFALTLLFPSQALVYLFFPLLALKTFLAGWCLYLYLKETGWFSAAGISLALTMYLFSGWYLHYLNHFPILELMIYLPFVFYGIECLFSKGKKRYFVLGISLLLLFHTGFTVLTAPIFLIYWLIRLHFVKTSLKFQQIRFFIISILTSIGLNMVFLLPRFMGGRFMNFSLGDRTILEGISQTFLPSLFNSAGPIPLFQSVLPLLGLSQFYLLAPKKYRWPVLGGYGALLILTLGLQMMNIYYVAGVLPFNLHVVSLFFVLFNSLLVAYVFADRQLNLKSLNLSCWIVTIGATALMGIGATFSWNFERLLQALISQAPNVFLWLSMLAFLSLYQYLSKLLEEKGHARLRFRSIYVLLILERIVFGTIYLSTRPTTTVPLNQIVYLQKQAGNRLMAVTNDLRARTPEFHRVANSFQLHPNEPLMHDYEGFSTVNPYLAGDMGWMFDPKSQGGTIAPEDYFLTTALGAKYYLTLDSQADLPGYEFFDRVLGITIYRNEFFASIGTKARYYLPAAEFQHLNGERKRYAFLRAVILEEQDLNLPEAFGMTPLQVPESIGFFDYYQAAEARREQRIEGIIYEGHGFSHTLESEGPELVAYAIPYARGWRALLNGEPVQILSLNQGFLGLEIPHAGNFEILLYYRIPGLMAGFGVSVTMLLFLAGYFYKKREDGKGVSV